MFFCWGAVSVRIYAYNAANAPTLLDAYDLADDMDLENVDRHENEDLV